MEELIKKLKAYAELYRKEPYGREVEGTAELLEEADIIHCLIRKAILQIQKIRTAECRF